MSYSWVPPLSGSYKVNVHTITRARQNNVNHNGIGVVIRDHRGRLISGIWGTMRGLSFMEAQLWALCIGLKQAIKDNCKMLTLETDNCLPFYEVVRKDGKGERSCFWIVDQIKELLCYNPEWVNNIFIINESANRSAAYLAEVGLNHGVSMHVFHEPFGQLQEKMDMDLGFRLRLPQLRLTPLPRYARGFVGGFAPRDDAVPPTKATKVPQDDTNKPNH